MRYLHSHKVNPANDIIEIAVVDEPGAGGANHVYKVTIPETEKSPTSTFYLSFQNGPIAECGVNGITQEVLLAIIIDRLQCFQRGPFACRENALALTKGEEMQHWLHHRTKARMDRSVEGTHEK